MNACVNRRARIEVRENVVIRQRFGIIPTPRGGAGRQDAGACLNVPILYGNKSKWTELCERTRRHRRSLLNRQVQAEIRNAHVTANLPSAPERSRPNRS